MGSATGSRRSARGCVRIRPRFAFWLSRDRVLVEDVVQEDDALRAWKALHCLVIKEAA